MTVSTYIYVGVACVSLGSFAYCILMSKFPGKGLRLITNIFKETVPFEIAIKALKEGKRIRRKSKYRGYTKIVLTAGKSQCEKFGSYQADDHNDVDDYCSFSIEDVLANDWLIEE